MVPWVSQGLVVVSAAVAFFGFRSHNMLTKEEEEHKEEAIQLTEEVLQARGTTSSKDRCVLFSV